MAVHRGIKECPSCGQEADKRQSQFLDDSDFIVDVRYLEEDNQWWIDCAECDCTGPSASTKDEAISLWNKMTFNKDEKEKQSETK